MATLGDPTPPLTTGDQSAAGAPGADGLHSAPTKPLALAAVGDRCANCGSPLASDQRYCVSCGERRGKPRFTLADPLEQTAAAPQPRASRGPRRPRTSSGLHLIAGVATLLLAMGVGVLIGHNNSVAAPGSTQPTVITVGSGSSAGTNTAAATTGSGSASHGGNAKHSAKSRTATKASAPTKVVIQKAAAAASKVTGGSAKVAAPTVSTGQSCSAGTAGCQNGKFTGGNFFGGG